MTARGPIYDTPLIEALPLSYGDKDGITQAMPSRSNLTGVQNYRQGQRVVAGYEILLQHYRHQQHELTRLRSIVEPLEALVSPEPVTIYRAVHPYATRDVIVSIDDVTYRADTLPEALAAAQKGATDD